MRNRAFLKVALLGVLALALVPGLAMASPAAMSSESAARATAVSGPVIAVSPLSYDFGRVNVGSGMDALFLCSNTGDGDLTVSSMDSSDPAFFGNPNVSFLLSPGNTRNTFIRFAPTAGGPVSATVTYQSDATNGPFTVNVSGIGNTAPMLDPIGNKTGFAFVNLAFTTTASDAEGDVLTFGVSGLPLGATFDTNTGHFDWTPGAADAGVYPVTFSVSDGLASDSEAITITISAGNNPPVSNPGGPYSGATGQPIAFDGSGSSDPDGNSLSFAWDFGDGGTTSGALASHTYAAAGSYLVTLTVTDNGSPNLSNSASTSASVINLIPASINLKLPPSGALRVNGGGTQLVGIETTAIQVININPASVKMSSPSVSGEISADGNKAATIGDIDGDNVPDLVVSFSRASINSLLGGLPNNSIITIVITATTNAGIPVRGTATVKVKGGGGAAVSANAAPNPFNPQTKVSWTLKNAGTATVKIYSLEGRLVKTLHDGFAPAGTSEIHWNGLDNAGRAVPTGVYFLTVQSAGTKAVQKLYLLK